MKNPSLYAFYIWTEQKVSISLSPLLPGAAQRAEDGRGNNDVGEGGGRRWQGGRRGPAAASHGRAFPWLGL